MFIYFTRALCLIYENARIRLAMTMGTGSVMIRMKIMETFSNFYFSLFKTKTVKMSIGENLHVLSNEPEKKTLHKKNISVNESTGGKDGYVHLTKFDGIISNTVLLKSLIPFSIFSTLLLIFPFAIFSGDLFLFQGCPHYLIYTPVLLFLLSSFFLIPIMLHSIYWIRDGLGMRNEITLSFLISIFFFLPFIVGFPIPAVAPEVVGNGIYMYFICYNSHFTSIIFPLYKVYQHNHIKATLKKTEEDYHKVLNDPYLYEELRNLMARELCIENALFLEELDRSREKFNQATSSASTNLLAPTLKMKKTLYTLYKKYIATDAPFQLNISYYLVDVVRESLDFEDAGFEVFDTVVNEVHSMLFQNTFQRYVLNAKNARKN